MDKPVPKSPKVLTRPQEGRWLGGVCAGLARGGGLKVAWVRLAFAAGSLIGIGAIAYVAGWLIIPSEGKEAEGERPAPGIVLVAQGCAGCAGLALLAVVAAGATVFGFGWVVLGVAAVVLAVCTLVRVRWHPVWTLLPVAALTLPSVAVATVGLRLAPSTASSVVAPRTLSAADYQGGLRTTLVDLRHTTFPASGTARLTIHAGVSRTIVALPQSRCVHVEVNYDVDPFLERVAALIDGPRPVPMLVVFGRKSEAPNAYLAARSGAPGPTLKVDVTSMGGTVYLRDYPDDVDPNLQPNWPGLRVFPERRPSTLHLKRRLARMEIRAWGVRHRREVASEQFVNARMYGPCGAPPA